MSRTLPMAALLVLGLLACNAQPTPTPTPDPNAALRGGVLATFDVTGNQFKAWVTNDETIDELLRWERGERESGIPNGKVRRGRP
ncbi:MAG: hypothetical protein FJ318_01075 [SAR202 cluster bacterium]|nr:hypothetical protein [SAR202 cluster bacterium]